MFGLKKVVLISLSNNSATAKETADLNVPPFVMDLYRSYSKHDGTVKRNSKRISASVHCLAGEGIVN